MNIGFLENKDGVVAYRENKGYNLQSSPSECDPTRRMLPLKLYQIGCDERIPVPSKRRFFISLIIAVLAFSLFDYIGYNLIAVHLGREHFYRGIQAIVQIIISVLLFFISGLLASVCFNLLQWTWCCDWVYYIIDSVCQLILGASFEGGQSLTKVLIGQTKVSWADWTPVGRILREKYVPNVLLIGQSLAGILIAVSVKIFNFETVRLKNERR